MDSEHQAATGVISDADASVAKEACGADIELSGVAGLERAPPAEHSISIEIASDLEAQRPRDQGAASSGDSRANDNHTCVARTDEQGSNLVNKQSDQVSLATVLRTLLQRMSERFHDCITTLSQEELQAHRPDFIAKLDASALAQCMSNIQLSPQNEEHFLEVKLSFYNYCGPLLHKKDSTLSLVSPSSSSSHPSFDGSISQFHASGLYFGETKDHESGIKVPSGFGLWTSVDYGEQGKQAPASPQSVTIIGGHWSDEALKGSMVHLCSPLTSGIVRSVGFSYRGSFARSGAVLTFDGPDAAFREFEAVMLKNAKVPYQVPLQLWHDLFIGALSDDGLERKDCRNFREHCKAMGFQLTECDRSAEKGRRSFVTMMTSFIGGGMQYFVPAVLKESEVAHSIMKVHGGGNHETCCAMVFDLVLFKGQWSKGMKDGICRHFVCYRNCRFPSQESFFTEKIAHDSNNDTSSSKDLFAGFKKDYGSRASVQEILRTSQFLSGSFFSGKFQANKLSYGSLFYYHRRFCLTFEHTGLDPTPSNPQWLCGNVKYLDCNTGSSFTEPWSKADARGLQDFANGVWSMGAVDSDESKFFLRESLRIGSQIAFPSSAKYIDVKDGLPGRMMRLFKADLSFYLCDSGLPCQDTYSSRRALEVGSLKDLAPEFWHILPVRAWSSAQQIWEEQGDNLFESKFRPITLAVDQAFFEASDTIYIDMTMQVQIVGVGDEIPHGRARLYNSLGIPIWQGELELGEPDLDGCEAKVSHRTVDIHTDVVESPDFGLVVLALCAPSMAHLCGGSDDEPHMVVALLPLPLLVAQWGMLLTVFYQSIKDWQKTGNPFCFKDSYDDNEDLNVTLYLCRAIMSFLCILYLKRAFQAVSELSALLTRTRKTKDNLHRRGLYRYGSVLGTACLIDSVADILADSLCLLINLWMVFGANKPIDMVLNSLALEFIKDIDNQFCQFFINDYPGIVSVIEKRLRQKDDSCSDLFFSPADTSYGKFSLLPAYLASIAHDITSDLSSFFVQAFYNDPDWGPDVGSTAIMYKLRSSCIFLVSLLLIPFYMATISLYVFAFAFFLVAYPLPMWFGMFGFKYVLRMLRGIAIAVSFITPVLILAFLLYSPICKRVTNDS